jgi:hypothetical protein
MGYCPRCGENSSLGTGPNVVAERRQPVRLPAKSAIVHLPPAADGETITYGGTRFKVSHDGDELILWAVD